MDSVVNSENLNEEGSQPEVGFFEISKNKLLIMSIGTFGLYSLYWFYQNWCRYNQRENADTWPIARTIFSIFFMHSLCARIEAYFELKKGHAPYDLNQYATLYVLVCLTSFLPEPQNPSVAILVGLIIAIVGVAGFTFVLVKIQNIINVANGEGSTSINDKLTGINYVWLTLGGLFWLSCLASAVFALSML
ncbi:hypothetical protein [Ferrimonas sp. YFM]|uniref:hypothetical protein n=1 Tax=Ferrimonas sp. YFM TaxID=3028878 RepID=UPI002572BF07|nr:hypothetical protein [Ferrimonas sp. YFM]BDY05744.1 hypothetical protein F0521_27850 [Ferrimonas sp. YFM]